MSARRSRATAYRAIGDTIDGRYRLDALIGAGSTGDVFRATRLLDGSTMALKVLDPALSRDDRQVERFRREAAVCTRLHHPHTVRVLDYGRFIDGRLFLAMEYLRGATLGATLRKKRTLTVTRACHIARQVAEALSEAHAQDIVHRDLKPDNIFLARVGGAVDFVKILDFGIARFVGDGTVQQTLTRTGFVAGTPLYLSPEQGLGKRLDGRSDLYTLGVVLYEMVVGRPPFMAETPIALVLKHIHETPPAPTKLNPKLALPRPLESLLRSLLAKNRDHRPARASDVSLLLEEIESLAARDGDAPAPDPEGDADADLARFSRLHALPLGTSARIPDGPHASDEEAFRELAALLREAMGDEVEADDGRAAAPARTEVVPVGAAGEDVAPDSPQLPVVVLDAPDGAEGEDRDAAEPSGPEPDGPEPDGPEARAEPDAAPEWGPAPDPDAVTATDTDTDADTDTDTDPETAPESSWRLSDSFLGDEAPAPDPPRERKGPMLAVLLLLLGVAGVLVWLLVTYFG